ncbi:MAG TPA: hypothetical protein VH280_08885 [Verrucomicrobiae bacterium]|jgi:hypothetical protein|nr:hypothetical protein [Verrucomicrobiae bacterium]
MLSNAYFLTGIYRCAQVQKNTRGPVAAGTIQVWDAAQPVIGFSPSEDQAQSLFADELRKQPEGDENEREVTVRKIFIAPIVGQLLTESGNVPLNWRSILEKYQAVVEATSADDFEQGYWVDVDSVVPSDRISFSVGTIESNVPEDVRSGLNWSGDKQFFFLLQVLPPPALPPRPAYETEAEGVENELSDEPSPKELEAMNAILPETVAMIQARNSVTAAWLWRKYAANTQWKANAIRIIPMCGTIGEPV